ncbi:MAG: hypothetical protein QXV52_08870 [Nitrososphaeria archaeon]
MPGNNDIFNRVQQKPTVLKAEDVNVTINNGPTFLVYAISATYTQNVKRVVGLNKPGKIYLLFTLPRGELTLVGPLLDGGFSGASNCGLMEITVEFVNLGCGDNPIGGSRKLKFKNALFRRIRMETEVNNRGELDFSLETIPSPEIIYEFYGLTEE